MQLLRFLWQCPRSQKGEKTKRLLCHQSWASNHLCKLWRYVKVQLMTDFSHHNRILSFLSTTVERKREHMAKMLPYQIQQAAGRFRLLPNKQPLSLNDWVNLAGSSKSLELIARICKVFVSLCLRWTRVSMSPDCNSWPPLPCDDGWSIEQGLLRLLDIPFSIAIKLWLPMKQQNVPVTNYLQDQLRLR